MRHTPGRAFCSQPLHRTLSPLLTPFPRPLRPPRQVNGHFAATLDPLGLDQRAYNRELDPASYGFTEADMDRE